METAKKNYHMACKEEKLAAAREADASVTTDQQKKLHEKTEKCKQDVQKVRKIEKRYGKNKHLKVLFLQSILDFPHQCCVAY